MDDKQIKQAAENVKEKLHFSGRREFYFEGDEKDMVLERKIDKEIDKALTRKNLSLNNYSLDKYSLTGQERAELKLEVIEEMLKQKGATEDDLKALRDAGKAAAEEMVKKHEEHLKNDFKVVNGKGNHGKD